MTKFSPQKMLSKRTSAVEVAAIIQMAQKAREMKAKGIDVVSLTLGEPDFDTPKNIRDAATKAMNDGFTHYAPMPGAPDLRQALAKKFKSENQLNYDWREVTVSNGAKQSITNAIFATVDEGDEVMLLGPYWAAYEGTIRMAGGTPVVVAGDSSEGFKPPAERIAQAITDKTKLLIINSPCNPTGAMFTKQELQAIANIVLKHQNLMVISDEIYEYIRFEQEHFSIGALPDMLERTITVNGFSKGFAMTGWRLGYAGAPAPVANAMAKVQGTFTAGCNPFVQKAAIEALKGPRHAVEEMRLKYLSRRDLIIAALNEIDGMSVSKPAGTFYAFPDVRAAFGTTLGNRHISNSEDLCNWLLEKHHLATVPGSAFGDDNAIRISFATSKTELNKAIERLKAAFAEITLAKT